MISLLNLVTISMLFISSSIYSQTIQRLDEFGNQIIIEDISKIPKSLSNINFFDEISGKDFKQIVEGDEDYKFSYKIIEFNSIGSSAYILRVLSDPLTDDPNDDGRYVGVTAFKMTIKEVKSGRKIKVEFQHFEM